MRTEANAPPWCPNPQCPRHIGREGPQPGWFRRRGFHPNRRLGPVPRFACRSCGQHFSGQTFAEDYWLQNPLSAEAVLEAQRRGRSLRAAARELGVSPTTVLNRRRRLADRLWAPKPAEARLTPGLLGPGRAAPVRRLAPPGPRDGARVR